MNVVTTIYSNSSDKVRVFLLDIDTGIRIEGEGCSRYILKKELTEDLVATINTRKLLSEARSANVPI